MGKPQHPPNPSIAQTFCVPPRQPLQFPQPDPVRAASYRIIDPRLFILSATFSLNSHQPCGTAAFSDQHMQLRAEDTEDTAHDPEFTEDRFCSVTSDWISVPSVTRGRRVDQAIAVSRFHCGSERPDGKADSIRLPL